MSLRFEFGEVAVREAIERWHGGELAETIVRDNIRRRIVRLDGPDGPLLVKQFRVSSGRHRIRETLKALIGASPASKEAHALQRLAAAGAPVPEPLALARLPGGDRVLALPFIEATSTEEALGSTTGEARHLALQRLGEAVHALHTVGAVHRDLHGGNVLFLPDGVVIVDLQNARNASSLDARLRDVASLVFSLRGTLEAEDADVLVRFALAEGPSEATRDRLEVLLRERAREHGAGRTRRAMRPGRRFARWKRSRGAGLRKRELEPELLERWLGAHRSGAGAIPIKREGRVSISRVDDRELSVFIKETGVGLGRALADGFRGSAGRRAWRAGHGLLARGIPAAEPLAFAERRVLGLPFASVVVLAAIDGPDGVGACGSQKARDAQLDLITQLHHQAIDHGDLKATNWIHREADGQAVLVDLEGVRFRKRLSDEARIEGLAQWNASLPDPVTAASRKRAFERYAAALPFSGDPALALREIVRRSLARAHRWTGRDCRSTDA